MGEPNWILRRATQRDAPALHSIEAACFGEPWSLELLREVLGDRKYLLLCIEDSASRELVGYAAAWSVLDEGQVDRLAVLGSQRRRGLGRALLEATLVGLAEVGVAKVFLEVRAGNAAAIELYRGCGFAEAGRRRAYYEDGEDAIVLRLGED